MRGAYSLEPLPVKPGSGQTYTISFADLNEIWETMRSAGIRAGRCLIVTDQNVADLYGQETVGMLQSFGVDPKLITLPPGETTKSVSYLGHIYDSALSWGIERSTPLIALGGGVVGDVGGFAAATLLRGLPLIQAPTTLIAQVDSAVGGKTGINHHVGKNLIGAFYQPRAVLIDTRVLHTLPEREWTGGLAEVVKHALIADESLLEFLETEWDAVAARRPEAVNEMVPPAVRVKADIVSQDEKETGLRAILNFGHTFAHAIEKVSGYGTFTHGEAVAAGMRAALHLSKRRTPKLDSKRADDLVARIPIPRGLGELSVPHLMQAMTADKKVQDGRLRFVLLDRIGHAYLANDLEQADVEAAWRHALEAAG